MLYNNLEVHSMKRDLTCFAIFLENQKNNTCIEISVHKNHFVDLSEFQNIQTFRILKIHTLGPFSHIPHLYKFTLIRSFNLYIF